MTLRFSLGIPRFFPDANGYSRIIQCAEALWRAPDVLSNTYTNCAWQNDLLDQAEAIAAGAPPTAAFGHALDPFFARVDLRRDTHWEYFYDEFGSALVSVYRRLGQLRRVSRALRGRESFYYWQQSLQGSQLIAFHRHAPAGPAGPEEYAMVILNFSGSADTIEVPFPKAGV